MPYLSSNIPSAILYVSMPSELLRIARCSLNINGFIPRACGLLSKMIAQGRNRASLTKQLKKACC